MSKQDRQGVRSASDLERKYDFSQIAEFSKANKNQNAAISQLTQTLAQFMADTNGKLSQLDDDLQFIEGFEGTVTDLQTAVSANTDSIEEVEGEVTALQNSVSANTESIEEVEGQVETLQTTVDAILGKLYPVGAIYVTVSDASPVDLFGGEWELIAEGHLLVGLPQENEEDLPELQQTVDTCYLWKRTA
jgi:vacuolar-type H+-ATPase subunit I/STV1